MFPVVSQAKLVYRPHIDGLRAIAVGIVILFHLNPSIFFGGYLGVDIFFVISGFVITQSLFKEYLADGVINIRSFYFRRFKRLYPALVTVVVSTIVLYVLFGYLNQGSSVLGSGVASIFAVSNFFFQFFGYDYFLQNVTKPFLHTWSLGIEEQFYFIYPALLVVGLWGIKKFKLKINVFPAVVLFFSICSYLIFSLKGDTVYGNFYFPVARFWELGAGCALFFLAQTPAKPVYKSIASGVGFSTLIFLQIYQLNGRDVYIETLVAVLVASAIIYSGVNGSGILVRFLQGSIINYFGKISYSLYLWHLPIIYFCDIYLDEIPFYLSSVLLSIICAMLSYHLIESKTRRGDVIENVFKSLFALTPARKSAMFFSLLAILVVGLLNYDSLVNIKTPGNEGLGSKVVKLIHSVNYIEQRWKLAARKGSGEHDRGCDGSKAIYLDTVADKIPSRKFKKIGPFCEKQVDGQKIILLSGDSHGGHYANPLGASLLIKDVYYQQFSRCHIIPTAFNCNEDDWKLEEDLVARSNRVNRTTINAQNVFYVLSWFLSPYQESAELIENNITKYVRMIDRSINIIFVAPTPVFLSEPRICIILGKNCTLDKEKDLKRRSKILSIYKKLQNSFENVFVYDPYEAICPGEECLIYDKGKDILYFYDTDHLATGSSEPIKKHFDAWLAKTFELQS